LGKAKDLGPHFIPFHSPWAATSPDLLIGSYALAKGVRIIMDRKTLNPGQQFDIDAIADCYWPWNAACC